MTKQGTNDATIKNTAERIVNSRISEFFQIGNNKIIAIIATQCEKWVLCKVEHLYIYSFRSQSIPIPNTGKYGPEITPH